MADEISLHLHTAWNVEALSRLAEPDTHLVVGSDVWAFVEDRRRLLLDRIATGDTPIYGANTGVGAMKTYLVPPQRAGTFNQRLIRDHAAGFGPILPRRIVRLMMAIRIIELAHGGSGISPSTYQILIDAYNAGITPLVPALGSMGEGDITLLAHIAWALHGNGRVYLADGRLVSAARALKVAGIPKLSLKARDGLALIGSNAYTAALLVDAMRHWRLVRGHVGAVTALSWIAWRANPSALREQVLSLVSPAVAQAGHEIWSWIADTPITPRDIHDPLSWRCAPHVLGAMDLAAQELADAIEAMVQKPRDNPVVLASGDVVSNGNFDVTDLVLRIDSLRNVMARTIAQQAQRVAKLLNHHYSGLTPGLARHYGDAGLGLLDFNVSALMTEAQTLAQGPLIQWGEVAEGVEDYGTLASVSALRLSQLISLWRTITATECVTALRAIDVQRLGIIGRLGDVAGFMRDLEKRRHSTPYDCVRRVEEIMTTGCLDSTCRPEGTRRGSPEAKMPQ